MSAARFTGQIAVVTGGAQGLGAAIAERLLSEGARVHLWDRDEDRARATAKALGEKGTAVTPLGVDVSSEESVQAAYAALLSTEKRLDVVVNSAGIVGPTNLRTEDTPVPGFRETLGVNLVGSFLITRHALPIMRAAGYGRILLIASVAGKEGNAGMCAYSAAKAGVIGLAKSTGKEVAGSGVTVNALAPAVIRTAMVDGMPEAQVEYMTAKIPMGRCGTLEEAASLACWIVSPEASFNTGAVFDLSGGRATY
jgi:NAD(P)-dependent dehydrogenase (short-subunit alcohol dehydrogenase family)